MAAESASTLTEQQAAVFASLAELALRGAEQTFEEWAKANSAHIETLRSARELLERTILTHASERDRDEARASHARTQDILAAQTTRLCATEDALASANETIGALAVQLAVEAGT